MATNLSASSKNSGLSVVRNKRKAPAYNDIDLDNWREYDYIETGTLWNIPSRAKGAGHKLDYYGGYVPQIATQVFNRFTKEKDIVLDLFLGSGTTVVEAMNMNRRCVGVELKKDLVNYVQGKVYDGCRNDIHLVCADSSNEKLPAKLNSVFRSMGEEKAQLLILHPPYADIIKFSDNEKDLSNCETTEDFLNKFSQVAKNGYDSLEKNRYAVLIIGDKYSKGELIPLGFLCMNKMNEIGFKTKSIIVKNIEGNEQGKGRTSNLWRYRALAGGFYIFKHEYVMIFQKK
ncbi:MAG: DNA methyltransferase [Cyanobacteriota bacterium]